MKTVHIGLIIGIVWMFTLLKVQGTIDTAEIDKGIIHVSYKSTSHKKLKVMIQKGEEYYAYNLPSDGTKASFPLQMGNGIYEVSIMENTTASKYRRVEHKSMHLDLEDSKTVYLNSVQEVNWSDEMKAIKKSKELTSEQVKEADKVRVVHQYMTGNYHYDYDKLEALPTTYLPVIDQTFKEKKGICYDFSSLYAAMLRSQGIPTKLVKGYSPNVVGYHAWNEAYDKASGKWWIIDTTYDVQILEGKKSVKMIKEAKDYQKVGEY